MFKVSGDYISNKIDEIAEEFNLSGDYEIEKQILEIINNESGDFIISWGSYTPHFSIGGTQIENVQMISGDMINFSKMERENPDLHTAMVWARTIICFSLGILLIKNYWTTTLMCLGIGVQVYDKTKEEQAVVTTTTIDEKGTRTTRTIKLGNNRWVIEK